MRRSSGISPAAAARIRSCASRSAAARFDGDPACDKLARRVLSALRLPAVEVGRICERERPGRDRKESKQRAGSALAPRSRAVTSRPASTSAPPVRTSASSQNGDPRPFRRAARFVVGDAGASARTSSSASSLVNGPSSSRVEASDGSIWASEAAERRRFGDGRPAAIRASRVPLASAARTR